VVVEVFWDMTPCRLVKLPNYQSTRCHTKKVLSFLKVSFKVVYIWEWRYSSTHSGSALDEEKWSASEAVALLQEKNPFFPLIRRLSGPQNRCGHCEETKIFWPCGEYISTSSVVQPVA